MADSRLQRPAHVRRGNRNRAAFQDQIQANAGVQDPLTTEQATQIVDYIDRLQRGQMDATGQGNPEDVWQNTRFQPVASLPFGAAGGVQGQVVKWNMNKGDMYPGMLHEGGHLVLGGDDARARQAAGAGLQQYGQPIVPGLGGEQPKPWAQQMLTHGGVGNPDSLLQAAIGDSADAVNGVARSSMLEPRPKKRFLDRVLTNDWRR